MTEGMARAGWAGGTSMILGVIALMVVLIHVGAGPFEPKPSAAQTIGETAAEIRQAATRAMTGAPQPEPEARGWDIDRILMVSGIGLAGLAVIFAVIGFIKGETPRALVGGAVLGGTALLVYVTVIVALIIVGGMVLYAIVSNIDGILGG